MNEFMKQIFSHCGDLNGELEEIMQTFDDGAAFCSLSVADGGYDFMLNAELNEFNNRYEVNDNVKFKLALMYVGHGEIFKDEDEFFNGTYGKSHAPESFIPHTEYDEDGAHQDPSVFICGKILSVENIDIDSEQYAHIKVTCLGCVLDLFVDVDIIPRIEEGNIICGLFDTIGLAI